MTHELPFILGVPTSDVADLAGIAGEVANVSELSEHRYFDGAAFIEALMPTVLSAAAWATLREWIRARAEVRKATRISAGGIEITAMNRRDAERIIELLASRIEVEDGEI